MKKLSKKLVARRLARKAQKLLKQKNVTIIAVTGSVGKTSAKIAIGKLLAGQFQVRFSDDSYNTDIGLPLSIFGLKAPTPLWDALAWQRTFQKINTRIKHYQYDVVVLELADDELDDMLEFLQFIKPSIGIVTGVAPVHMERLQTMDKVVQDNWEIVRSAKQVFYNADQSELRNLGKKLKKAEGFGLQFGKVAFENIKANSKGYLKADLKIGKQKAPVTTHMIAPQSLYGLLAAACVGDSLGMETKAIARGLSKVEPINGRMRLLPGIEGIRIIDDSYNSSPLAAEAALGVLSGYKGRKIAVLGNMNELGDYTQKAHTEVGAVAAKTADILVVIGKDAETHLVAGAQDAGMKSDNIKIFKSPYEAGHFLKRFVQKGDVVLVKGSQNGVHVEEVSRILLDPELNPEDVLVRQTKTWKRRKRRSFA